MTIINIKPLSVNQCWQGRRFKTPKYNSYEKELLCLLPPLTIPEGKLKLDIVVAFSNRGSDIDNVVKPLLDILQKKYAFNDSRVYEITILKTIVKKGTESISFCFETFCR